MQEHCFSGGENEELASYLRNFMQNCSTIEIKGVSQNVICLRLFSYSLQEKALDWYFSHFTEFNTWDGCLSAFAIKYFPRSEAIVVRKEIICFWQTAKEIVVEA